MTRTKWLTLSTSQSTSDIANLLSQQYFQKGRTSGFDLTEKQKGKIRGRFIEEVITNELVIDPFGEEILNNVRRYTIFEFQLTPIRKNEFLIGIHKPPTSLKNFISVLSEVLGFGFSIETLNIDILAMVQLLRKQSGISVWAIKKVRMSNITLNNSSFAKIEVVSNSDAYLDLKKNIDVKSASLERATIEWKDDGKTKEIELVSTGMVLGDLDVLNSLIPTFQLYFANGRSIKG